MDIIQRNLFRLLRCGAFGTTEQIEPMSAYKWAQLLQLARMHHVVSYAWKGTEGCSQQFFLKLNDNLRHQWREAAEEESRVPINNVVEEEEDDLLRPDQLTNPVLNRKLQAILDDERSDMTTRKLLLSLIRIVRHLFNEGMPIRLLMELGFFLRRQGRKVDAIMLQQWIRQLHISRMSQLEGQFLMLLFCFEASEIPFMQTRRDKAVERIAQELISFTNTRSEDWYFSQEAGSIFVHSSNSSAMFRHVRRSARYFRYYPSESLTNFFASFVHSLSHIEE